jgi:hypothetical protein
MASTYQEKFVRCPKTKIKIMSLSGQITDLLILVYLKIKFLRLRLYQSYLSLNTNSCTSAETVWNTGKGSGFQKKNQLTVTNVRNILKLELLNGMPFRVKVISRSIKKRPRSTKRFKAGTIGSSQTKQDSFCMESQTMSIKMKLLKT